MARRQARRGATAYGEAVTGSGRAREALQRATKGAPRVVSANRQQLEWRAVDLQSVVAADHPVRAIWALVERLDLSGYTAAIEAREATAGRPATDPRILLSVWLYAYSQGVGHAREVARLCAAHDAYRWICGGVRLNYHTLSDFRVAHEGALDEVFSQVVGVLWHQGLVTLERVAQDGLRVRAAAGTSSFRRAARIEQCLQQARQQLAEVKRAAADEGIAARQRAAAARAARERLERLEAAQRELAALQAQRAQWQPSERRRAREPRVSTTDPSARALHMPDGGWRPAYNVQWATDTRHDVIVGVGVTTGNDAGEVAPMISDIERRTGETPGAHLVDGGYASRATVEWAAEHAVPLYSPVLAARGAGADGRRRESAAVAAWRARMSTDEAKTLYKERAASVERLNADARAWRGFTAFPVRGLRKVLGVTLLVALTHNVLRWIAAGAILP
jgi:transposase